MSDGYLAERVEQHPLAADNTFARLDRALNLVLPGSDTHERYESIEEVGLAVVIAISGLRQQYNPFNPTERLPLSFMADNRDTHPGAWEPKDTDAEILGGTIQEGVGRFTAYALAKINTVSASDDDRSYREDTVSIGPGRIGIAGGRWVGQSLVGVSGLWEVHDHITAGIYVDEFWLELDSDTSQRTADNLAEEIEPVLACIKSLHQDVEAADLSRKQIAELLLMADGVMSRFRTLRLEDVEE